MIRISKLFTKKGDSSFAPDPSFAPLTRPRVLSPLLRHSSPDGHEQVGKPCREDGEVGHDEQAEDERHDERPNFLGELPDRNLPQGADDVHDGSHRRGDGADHDVEDE
jgi:hypothetical protein